LVLSLPPLTLPKPQPVNRGGEAGELFSNVKKALVKQAEAEAAEVEGKARQEYQTQVAQSLASVTETVLLPSTDMPEPSCSDVNGVLHRITATTSAKPRLVLLITDGHESCVPTLQSIQPPKGPITVVTILIPEKVVGKKHKVRSYDQFETRSAALVQAAPWADVHPYHQQDFVKMFSEGGSELTP
jgi:hypothetical protein